MGAVKSAAGAQIDSVAYFGGEPAATADVRLVNGAEIGWVPDPAVASVTVSTGGISATAAVVAHHFLLVTLAGHDDRLDDDGYRPAR